MTDRPDEVALSREDAEELISEWRHVAETADTFEVRETTREHADQLAEALYDE